MKADLRSGDGPEREELRPLLRRWHVPSPPPEIEEDLRRTFRRRRARGRPVFWPSVAAAALGLLALWRIGREDRPATPAPTPRPVAVASPLPPSPLPPRPDTAEARRPSPAALSARPQRRPTPPPREAEVIVESGQGQLLAELGRKLRGVRQAVPATPAVRIEEVRADAPATPFPVAEAADVPRYRAGWETIGGKWPSFQRSVFLGGR